MPMWLSLEFLPNITIVYSVHYKHTTGSFFIHRNCLVLWSSNAKGKKFFVSFFAFSLNFFFK